MNLACTWNQSVSSILPACLIARTRLQWLWLRSMSAPAGWPGVLQAAADAPGDKAPGLHVTKVGASNLLSALFLTIRQLCESCQLYRGSALQMEHLCQLR